MRPPALIGEAPGRDGAPNGPLNGRPGRVLCDLAGWPSEHPGAVLASRFWVTNLLDSYPGPSGKGTAWPTDLARRRAHVLLDDLRDRVAVVLLGRRVAHAFGIRSASYAVWHAADGFVPTRHVVLPHPSGINRALNDKELRREVGARLREVGGS